MPDSDSSSTGALGGLQTVTAAAPRPLGAALILAGLAHLLAPGALLWLAARGYDRVLDVEFAPGEASPRRVRALGAGMVLAGAHLLYHGGIVPN
jgi:hypothetical protein